MAIAQEPCVASSNCFESSTESQLLRLYGGPRTRATIIQWHLEELDVPYQYISLDLSKDEHRQPEYLEINPIGKVPAIVDQDFILWESGAILIYLAEKYAQEDVPLETRAQFNQWVLFANATLGPGLFNPERREREIPRLLPPLNQILQKQPFLMGEELTVADIAVASYLYYAVRLLSLDFKDYPAVEQYLDKLSMRPAFQKTLGQR